MAAAADKSTVEPAFYDDCRIAFLSNLVSDGQNSGLSGSDRLLRPPDSDIGDGGIIGSLVDVDLSISVILDLIDGCAPTSKDSGNRTSGYSELENIVRFLLEFKGLEK